MGTSDTAVDTIRSEIQKVCDEATESWEKLLVGVALSALSREGSGVIKTLSDLLLDYRAGKTSDDELVEKLSRQLSLHEASDFLVVLETDEANRLQRSNELLSKVYKIASTVTLDLLKIALGSLG